MGKPQLNLVIAVGLNSIQRTLDHSAPSNTTPLGANLQLIERARSNRGNTVYQNNSCSVGLSKAKHVVSVNNLWTF